MSGKDNVLVHVLFRARYKRENEMLWEDGKMGLDFFTFTYVIA